MRFEVAHANPRILRHYARVVGNSALAVLLANIMATP